MERHPQQRHPAAALRLLEPTAEEQAAGIYRVQLSNGAIAKLTQRQIDIIMMPPHQKKHVPHAELVEIGKIMMPLQEANIDEVLQNMDEDPIQAPELVPEPYVYKPLSKPTSLRLIQMLPEDADGMIQISLEEYDLDHHIPDYYCLSYCWGNPHAHSNTFTFYEQYAEDYDEHNLFPISCNGRLLYVRANLYDALKQLPDAPGLQVKDWHEFQDQPVKFTDLHSAVASGSLALVKTVLFRGAHVDANDTQGRTSLMIAVIVGSLPVVDALLEAGADPQARDYHGMTSIDHALQHSQHEIVDRLLLFDPTKVHKYKRKNKHIGRGAMMWIDAICINQDDVGEKNEQVRVMYRIFSQARFTTLWLGKDDSTGASAASAVRKLYSIIAIEDQLELVGIQPYKPTTVALLEQMGSSQITQSEWLSLATLYLRQLFQRLWCLQEAVLPKQIVMYLGEYEIPWHEFMLVTEQIYMLQKGTAIPVSAKFRPVFTAAIEAEAHLISELRMRRELDQTSPEQRAAWFRGYRRFWRGKDKLCQIPLFELIAGTTTFKCFDPRDHVYGLLGICQDHPESPQIEVDYRKPWTEIYTQVVRMWFQSKENPSLGLVASIKDSALGRDPKLPSWVVDFSQAGIAPISGWHYAAAGENSQQFDVVLAFSGQDHELVVEGKCIDTIQQAATQRPMDGTITKFNFDPLWSALVLSLPQTYPHTNEPRTEVLWRTLCKDAPSEDDIADAHEEHAKENESTSKGPLDADSKAPTKYAIQFRDQLCASILAYAEQQAHGRLKMRTSRAGVLFQALMSLQQDRDTDSDQPKIHRITAPTEEELASIHDTSLEGPYFTNPKIVESLDEYERIHRTDSLESEGPGCATPSRQEISAFLKSPSFRVWHSNPRRMGGKDDVSSFLPQIGSDTQALSELPRGQDGFRAQFSKFHGARRLFVTKDQKYLGLGPMSMETGDEVWLLKGSRIPMLLRRIGEAESEESTVGADDGKGKGKSMRRFQYKYVGDLYVHGIMYGEAVDATANWEEIALA